MRTQRTGILTLRNGLILGAILGMLGVGNTLIQWIVGAYHLVGHTTNGFSSVSLNNSGASSMLGCLVFLAMLALTFIAGMLTARGTGRVGSGALSGLLTGVVGGLISGIGSVVVMVVLVVPSLPIPQDISMTPTQVETLIIGVVVVVSLLAFLVETGFGAGMGALGGLIGANRYRQAMPPALISDPPRYPGYSGIPAQPDPALQQSWVYPNPPQRSTQQETPPPPQQ